MPALRKFLFLLALSAVSGLQAQYLSIDESHTVEQLVNDVLIDNPCATGTNVVLSGWTFSSGASYGAFDGTGTTFPFASGVVLTTGRAASAPGPNSSLLSEGPTDWPGDTDLEDALGVQNTINATILEFDFLPVADKFSFDYIFSSEQYLTNPSPNQCNYTDGFAFLLKKAGTSDAYQNLAVVPGTTTPVLVNTVRGPGTLCPQANPQWFDSFNEFEHPTNYNGQTKIMTAMAQVEPNVLYHIKIVVADQGNNLYDSAIFLGAGTFQVTKDLGPDRLLQGGNPICFGENLIVDATMPGAVGYQWLRNGSAIPGATSAQYTIIEDGDFSVQIDLGSGCFASGEISVEFAPQMDLSDATLIQCDPDADGQTGFDLEDAQTQLASRGYYVEGFFPTLSDAQNGTGNLTISNLYAASHNASVIAKVQNMYNCVGYVTVYLQITYQPPPASMDFGGCDEDDQYDGITYFSISGIKNALLAAVPAGLNVTLHLSQADALTGNHALSDPWQNTTAWNQTLYATYTNGPDCYAITEVHLEVYPFDNSGLGDENLILCATPLTLSAPTGFSSYTWSTGETTPSIVVDEAGNYSVTVTSADSCSGTKNFQVTAIEAPVFEGVDTRDFAGNENQLTILFSGSAAYEFSIDGSSFQSSPTFSGLRPDTYEIYIREPNCNTLVGPFAVSLLDYPRFFSPNGDGYNDIWQIKNLPPASQVFIFDRYGKLLKTLSGSGGWNGELSQRKLPASDYWFLLQRPGKPDVKGHFSLIR